MVKPLIKKQNLDVNKLENYRPVSSTPFLGKLLEKTAVLRLCRYLQDNNLLEEFQSAYKRNHSTETALLKVKNDITRVLDQNKAAVLVMLDLSAAFDSINQSKLLSVLESNYRIQGKALSWFRSYLEERSYRVVIDGASSDPVPLSCGVPQGSVLGPIMFTLYTAPLCHILRRHGVMFHKYADDIQIYVPYNPSDAGAGERAVELLSACIMELRHWMLSNQLMLNMNKTEVIYFISKNNIRKTIFNPVTVGSNISHPSRVVRNLGVIMDRHLDMANHITSVCASCNFHIRRLSTIRPYLSLKAVKSAVQALITSRLDYCNSLLLEVPSIQLSRLQRIQNKAARLVTRTSKKEHITPVLKNLHWLPVSHRVLFKTMVLVYKCLNNQAPNYLQALLQPYRRDARLRQAHESTLYVPVSKGHFGKSAFSCAAPSMWNQLPIAVREAKSLQSFKRSLKTYLFRMVYD